MCRLKSAMAVSTEREVPSTTSAELWVLAAAPATSPSTCATLAAARAALATFDEMLAVAAFCCSTEAATPEV
jgi:hypothetical protein